MSTHNDTSCQWQFLISTYRFFLNLYVVFTCDDNTFFLLHIALHFLYELISVTSLPPVPGVNDVAEGAEMWGWWILWDQGRQVW